MMAPLRRVLLDEKEIDYVSQRFNTKRGGEREKERERKTSNQRNYVQNEKREKQRTEKI